MFTDPIAQVVITSQDKKLTWAWSAGQYTDPNFTPMPFLTGVTIIYEWALVPTVTINIDAPYEDGLKKMLVSPSPFAIGNGIKARIGYAGGLFTPWAEGVLYQGGDQISVDPNGVSGSVSFTCTSDTAFYTIDKSFKKGNVKTLEDALDFCCKYMGLKLNLMPGAKAALSELFSYGASEWTVSKANSAWEIMRSICQENGLRWFVGSNPKDPMAGTRVLNVFLQRELEAAVSMGMRRSYVMRGVVDVSKNQYPCSAWSPEGEGFALWMNTMPSPEAAGSFTVLVKGIGKDEKELDKVTAEKKEALIEQMKVKTVGAIPKTPAEKKTPEGSETAGEKTDKEQGKYKTVDGQTADQAGRKLEGGQQTGNPVQQGTITCPIGIPEEFPGNFCYLGGCGQVFDGWYHIRKMTHTYNIGNWEMSLGVFRYGVGGETSGTQVQTSEGSMQEGKPT